MRGTRIPLDYMDREARGAHPRPPDPASAQPWKAGRPGIGMSASLLSRLKNIRNQSKNFLKFRKTRYPSVPAWDIRRFQEVFVRYRGVLREAEEE